MKIGIFGGTFNPIHQGHLAIADDVRRAIPLDEILFIPAGMPPHKNEHEVVPAHHRLEMVRLAIMGHSHFKVSDMEIRRPGKSYTIQTVEELWRTHSVDVQWYLLLGTDAFLDFPSWRDPDRIMSFCNIVVVSRPGFRFRDLERLPYLKESVPEQLGRLDQKQQDPYEVPLTPATRLILIQVSPWEVSATEIRNHLSGGKRKRNLLPGSVESYIITNNLYNQPR